MKRRFKRLMKKWARACTECDVQFVKKGTEEYNRVLKKFKELV